MSSRSETADYSSTLTVTSMRAGLDWVLVPIRSPDDIVRTVRELVEDCGLRQTLGSAAREDARRYYTWDLAADRVAAAYARIVATPPLRSMVAS